MNDENDRPKNDDWGMTMPHLRLERDQSANDLTDDFAPPRRSANQPPADDWGMTQQNFNLPNDQSSSSDFDKTTPNINIPQDVWRDSDPDAPQSAPDEWGVTAPNINISQASKEEDWTMDVPNRSVPNREKEDGWSMPEPVFRISEGEKVDNLPKRTTNFDQNETDDFGKTTPNFNLSEISSPGIYGASAPNRNSPVPPNPSEQFPVNQIVRETPKTEKPAVSKLIYALGGLIALLFFSIVALAAVYFLFLNKPEKTRTVETLKEESIETTAAPAPIAAAPPMQIVLPKEIEYKGVMVLVSAGEFTMGSDTEENESKPAHKVFLPAFYIDKTEVTNGEYKKFCDAIGKSYPADPHLEKNYFINRPSAPVVGVSFADAREYAAWAGKRLPSEAEWEKAASWDDAAQSKRRFPWGNDFQTSSVAFGLSSISDVGKFPAGASSSGALDMAGNVLEWVDAFFQPYPNSTLTNAEFGEKNRVARGGHFGSKTNDSLKTTKRIYVAPDIASGEDDEKLVAAIIGFRCAVSADASAVKDVLQTQSK